MKHGLIAGIAAIAIALAVSALLVNWEQGPAPNSAGLPDMNIQEGRAATTTDPAQPNVNP